MLTLVVAWPVVRHPTTQIYGREIVGRQPDTYRFIQHLAATEDTAASPALVTQTPGRVLARVMPPVAAFNVLFLLSFPLTAMATYALARYLTASHGVGLIAGLAFTFSPARLAHAAYHQDLTQAEWIPLFLLTLVAAIDRRSLPRLVALACASALLVWSSAYGALLCAVLSPVVLIAFWAIRPDADRNLWPLALPTLILTVVGAVAATVAWRVYPEMFAATWGQDIPIDDVAFYRARWWAYLTPAVDHPILGGLGQRVFDEQGINLQLTEEQLFLGYALLTLAGTAIGLSARRWFSDVRWRFVAATAAVAIVALIVSLGPTSGSCEPASTAPGCLIFRVAPMFRTYARFGLLVQLMVALTGAAGAVMLARYSPAGRRVVVALLTLAVFEYWPLPARTHDVLPSQAHRWLASTVPGGLTLDCYPGSATEDAIASLMGGSVRFLGDTVRTCGDPQLGMKLAGLGYTQVIVRRSGGASPLPTPLPVGISQMRSFADADAYAVATTPPPVLTLASSGFFGLEHDGDDWWQWMGPVGQWTVRNTTTGERRVTLSMNLVSVGLPRRLSLTLDGAAVGSVLVGTDRQEVVVGPWRLTPGTHTLAFAADGDPVRPVDDVDASRDRRSLTIAFRRDRWVDAP